MLRATKQYTEILAAGDGNARVSKQYVEILAAGIGTARVTHQYVEILVKEPYELSITDPISLSQNTNIAISALLTNNFTLSQEASTTIYPTWLNITDPITLIDSGYVPQIFELSITDNFTLVSISSYVGPILLDSNNIITLLNFADVSLNAVATIVRSIDDIIIFNDVSDGDINYTALSITDTLLLEQVTTTIRPYYRNPSDIISFEQLIGYSVPRRITIEDSLLSTEQVFDPDEYTLTEVDTGLRQEATRLHVSSPAPQNHCYFNQEAIYVLIKSTSLDHSATDHLLLSDMVYYSHAATINDTITLVQTLLLDHGKGLKNIISLNQEVEIHGTFGKGITDDFNINQTLAHELQRNNTLCTYSPFIGTTTADLVAPPRPTGLTLIKQDNIQFTYGATTIILRGPEFGNRDRLKFTRVNRESRGGTLVVYADPIWPQVETMLVEFYGLYETESQSIIDFIVLSLGKEIEIRDWENRSWIGVITNPNTPIIRNSKNNNTLTLELDIQSALYNQDILDTITIVSTSDRQHVHGRSYIDSIIILDDPTYPVLDWKTFTELEWETFSSFEWNQFIGE